MTDLKGKFIAFDGGEGCGKSTQTQMLRSRLEQQGLSPIIVRDPGATRIGELVRAILLNPDHDEMGMRAEMLLYMSARAQMMQEVILPALADGKTVICDRFVSSTLAYQMGGDGLTADEIRAVAQIAIKGRWPDLTLILDMPAEASIARVTRAKDRIEQRPLAYHQMVRQNYLAQAQADPKRVKVIAADRDQDVVYADVWAAVRELGEQVLSDERKPTVDYQTPQAHRQRPYNPRILLWLACVLGIVVPLMLLYLLGVWGSWLMRDF